MNLVFDTHAPKKATNISINSDLLVESKKLKINLSATLETSLIELIRAKQRKLWRQQNKAAIEACNQLVDENRICSDEIRNF